MPRVKGWFVLTGILVTALATGVLAASSIEPDAPRLKKALLPNSPEANTQLFGSFPSQVANSAWGEESTPTFDEQLASALAKAIVSTGSVAKTVGKSITTYIKEKQLEEKQNQVIQSFYYNLDRATQNLGLHESDYHYLRAKIKTLYIEDAESGNFKLDTQHFRDMPRLIQKEYAEILFKRTQNGAAETYYPDGSVKTKWNMKNGKPDGKVTTFYEDGEILYVDIYKDGEKIKREKFDREGKLEFAQEYSGNSPSAPPVEDTASVQIP